MAISIRRTFTETADYNCATDRAAASVRTENRYAISGTGILSLTGSCIELGDSRGELNRHCLTYWADHDEIPAAIVDWLAALHRTATDNTASESGRAIAVERLQRFAGAMGLSYGAAMATLPGEVRATNGGR